jgi:hypothetical protein
MDVNIDYVNKIISRVDGTSVDSVNALYSQLQDDFDELTSMDDQVPMSAQTPTSYTMINGWYIQEELTQWLDGGAIQTDGYNGEIRTLICDSTGWTNFEAADIGDAITGSITGDTGTLLDYDNAAYKLWIRMDAAGDLFDNDSEDYTGAGVGTAEAAAISTTGEHIFANLYTLGTLEGDPTLYIFQDGERLDPDWWDSGHIDVLVKVKESGVDIDSKKVTVFCRNWTDTFDAFNITLTTAGQNAVPLGTSDDLNNQTIEGTVENWQNGVTHSIAIAYQFAAPFSYDIGDGNGVQDYEIQINCNSQSLAKVYEVMKYWTRTGSTKQLETGGDGTFMDGEEYRYADSAYAEVKASPLGTFAGGTMFGARSVYFTNLHGDDAQAFQLVDKAGTTRNPPNYQAFTINGTVAGDRCAVYLEDGSGVVKKDQYTVITDNALNTITVSGAIPVDTPDDGTIIVVETDGSETHYAYSSWSGSDFTIVVAALTFDGTEKAYVPYILVQAAGDSVTETSTIYVANRAVLCVVRKKGILPFETTGNYTSTGYAGTAIRTTDSIVT